MTRSEELTWRGFVNQMTYSDIKQLDEGQISFYFGVDPSADSMQIGNLAAAMMVRHFINYGHQAFLLVGGATGIIGDPDGKKSEREAQSVEKIASNKAAIASQYDTVFAGQSFTVVDNYDWFKDINYIDFLRMIGKNVPLSQMLGREFVQSRLGEGGNGISYAEFSYSLIQGYDFLHLYREHGVTLQVCGADQWGNSVAGIDLIRRIENAEANVYSVPLIYNTTTGVKFGKSEDGAIWLDDKKTTVYQFYQFWLNTDDAGVIDYLKVFTLLSREEIDAAANEQQANPAGRSAQKLLAQCVTDIVHGNDRRESVQRVTEVLFGGADFSGLSDEDVNALAAEIPASYIGVSVVEAIVSSGQAGSNGEAKRLIESGAISLNGQKVDVDSVLESCSLIKKGKNSFILVK